MPESLFIIELIYKVPLEELDESMIEHVKFLDKYYKKGNFITSGRKVPRTGGIILARAKNKEAITELMTEDPFTKDELADYNIIEFLVSQSSQEFKELLKSKF
jgi:uncharacterized protein YciI